MGKATLICLATGEAGLRTRRPAIVNGLDLDEDEDGWLTFGHGGCFVDELALVRES